jgi:hypothetical protein
MSRIAFVIILSMAVLALLSVSGYLGVENRRLAGSLSAALSDGKYYRTKDSLSAASVEQLTLTNSELKRHYADIVKEAENLNLKVRRLQSASRTATVTEYKFETKWRDSVVYRFDKIDTIRCIRYEDEWVSFAVCERDGRDGRDIGDVRVAVRDTVVQFVHRVPRRFLFLRFGTKGVRQEVVSKNPYTEVVFTEYIKLVK